MITNQNYRTIVPVELYKQIARNRKVMYQRLLKMRTKNEIIQTNMFRSGTIANTYLLQ